MEKLVEKLLEKLKKLNPNMDFAISDYNPSLLSPWIDYCKDYKDLMLLPKGAYWVDKDYLMYHGRKIYMIQMV